METIIQSALMGGQQSLYIVAIIFATGVLTSLTPCVYPMLPITVSVIGKQARSRQQAFLLSILYVLGLALVYAGLGMLAASTGQLFGSVASHPVTLLVVAVFCLLMAMWILGWITLPSPEFLSVTHSAANTAPSKRKYAWLNVFIAGCLSGLVMAPCTSPVLGMLLMYVASDGEPLWAGLLMFTFAIGMSTLLILAGSFSGLLSALPRSGHWLNTVKWLMALPMFAVAIYLIMQASAALTLF
ncbi:MAG: sulfite exporter TauE/SafE family protein [Colwellia sp.]|nr:sulfite exporter TauE/SafE family protein [Colwellia sp.]